MRIAPASQYTAQSPRPHSPPQTPSSRPNTAFPTVEHGTIELNTPATTPEPTLISPSSLHPSASSLDRRTSSSSAHSSASTSGMGITFPVDNNPLPSELSEGKKQPEPVEMARSLSDTATPSEQPTPSSSGMAASRSAVGGNYEYVHGQTLQAGSTSIHRPRSNSPSPIKNTNASSTTNGFASSSSYHPSALSAETRERIVSPTRPSFDKMQDPLVPPISIPSLGAVTASETSPMWSPAIDGKKEPSIKPAPFGFEAYNPDLYAHPGAKNRARSPFPQAGPGANGQAQNGLAKAEYQPHPLTGGQAYNQATAKEGRAGEGFYDSVAYWLGLYFFFNLGLTLFNKIVLVSFPFPYTLTGLHALSGCAGCYFALERGAFVPARLTQKESLILAAFSVLYTINIAVSNISLQLVTVPFHQVVRASTPLFTILISTVILRTRFSVMKLVSLLPVVAGVGFATYGDYYFTAWGLILTLLGTFLAALKTVVTNLIQTGGGQRLKLHPLDLLMRMSPLAFIQCVAYGWYTGELERVRRYGATQMTRSKAIALLVNGVIACGLNIVSFTANKKAGALTMTVSANCKQVLTIALAVFLFDLSISPTNGVGILLTLIGGGWYGYVEYQEKNKKTVKIVDRS